MPGIDGNTPKAYSGGTWKDWAAVQGKLDGTWKLASDVYMKSGGVWKRVWVRLTAPTNGTSSISHVTATISWTAGVGQEGFKLYRNGTFVKNVAGTTTTDVVPTMQADHVYTVSAYSGTSETAQVACGTVRAEVGTPTASASINRDWSYSNSTWDGQAIIWNHSCTAVSNATAYQYSYDDGASVAHTGSNAIVVYGTQDSTYFTRWRAYITHNGVNYFGAWSNRVTLYAGRPLIRNAQQNVDYNKTVRFDQTIGETVDFGAFGAVVDSYEWRNVNAVGSSLLANSVRRVTFVRPGANIVIPYGSSTVSGTGDDGGNYRQGPYYDYTAGFYGVQTFGSWSVSSEPYVTYTLRFVVRSIAQVNIPYSIT